MTKRRPAINLPVGRDSKSERCDSVGIGNLVRIQIFGLGTKNTNELESKDGWRSKVMETVGTRNVDVLNGSVQNMNTYENLAQRRREVVCQSVVRNPRTPMMLISSSFVDA